MKRISLTGSLAIPDAARGVVLWVVGAPEHRTDELRLHVADVLHEAGLATLIACLTAQETAAGVERLAWRVTSAFEWIQDDPRLRHLALGVLADGAAVGPALIALAHRSEQVVGFAACGGLPDTGLLSEVHAPVLLIAAAHDEIALASARAAVRRLPANAEIAIIDDTTDLFADPAAADTVAWLARRWFVNHLVAESS